MNHKPIKRDKALQPLSREHHHGLLFCWKIREGFKRSIQPERIKKYADWFWENHLAGHFETEERYIFPLLGNENELVKKALANHRRLKRLFEQDTEIIKTLSLIEEKLESHIRFEERILFNEVQKLATPQQFEDMEKLHIETTDCENWEDKFWK